MNLINTEIKKIMYLKSTKIYFLLTLLLGVATSLMLTLTTNVTQSKLITEFTSNEILEVSMFGVDTISIMFLIFSALYLANELTTKQIYFGIQICPNRAKFFLTKFLTLILIVIIMSTIGIISIIITTQIILIANNMSLVNIVDINNFRLLISAFCMPIFYTAITISIMFALKNTGLSITFSLGLIAIPAIIKLFGDNVQKVILPLLPQSAIHSISGSISDTSFEYSKPFISILILIVWVILFYFIGLYNFKKSDF